MIQALPDYAVQFAEMEGSLQELKKLVNWGWTYAVIWKIGPDHRTPTWHQSYLSESLAGGVVGLAQRFESIYRQCQFTSARPGYAYMAWMMQSPFWWTRLMEPVLTDESKELFLKEVGIQTLVCFPGRATSDGTGYCLELACSALVSETDALRTSIQDFLNTSIDPYISSPPVLFPGASAPLDMESYSGGLSSSSSMMAALAHQTSAILTDITSQASMGDDEALDGFGNFLRREEPYAPWTMSSSHYVSPVLPNFQSTESFDGFQDLSFNYEPFEGGVSVQPQLSTAMDSGKGKEILVEEGDLVLATGKALDPAPSLNSLQQELLEKLRSPPGVLPGSPKTLSPGYRSMRPAGIMPPGHISSSRFRPHDRQMQIPKVMKKKRKPLIYKWATRVAPRIKKIRDEIVGAGGSSFDGLSPGTEGFDPRSPNSVAHDQQAALAHKIAERNRRMKFTLKLQTLISIVPMANKKKDKVSVLTSTIDYIRQLNLQISTLKKTEEEATVPILSTLEAEGDSGTMDREELSMFNEADRPSSSSPSGGAPVVVVEGEAGDDTWVIKVEATTRSRSLIQLLNVLVDLEFGVVTVDYGSLNGRFHANICIKNSKSSSTSSDELQARLCRVLEARDSFVTDPDD